VSSERSRAKSDLSVLTSTPSNSVIQRAGVVTMSITAVAKEVTTIMVSAVVFGDELTPLNVTGVGLTICG
jgi:hypothetical protein